MKAAIVLTVLTLNAAGPRHVHQSWESRRAALSAGLAVEAPDAASFQEIWRAEDADALAQAAGHAHRAHEPALGLAVTSRRRIVDRAALDLGGGAGILRAGLDLDGIVADVYSVRLNPGALNLGQLLAAAEFVRAQSSTRPFVLLGDLAVAADDKESALFLDLLGARDLCVSHGDEICGRTWEDRRVDYALIPYASRPPRETARVAFTGLRAEDDEVRPVSTHFGLVARLDASWLKLRAAREPEGRVEALADAAERLDAARARADARAQYAGWIPFSGTIAALRARADSTLFAADGERARTALARAAKPAAPAYE